MQDNNENSRAILRKSTDQLAGSSNVSPIIISETSAAIKPKAVRLKPLAFKLDKSVQAASLKLDKESIEISKESSKTILYRPLAQVVSSSTLLRKLANYEEHDHTSLNIQDQTQQPNQINSSQQTLNLQQSFAPLCSTNKLHCSSSSAHDSEKTKAKSQHTTNNWDRNSSDGYNWRKYGQKQVKGSEYPRAYYKCTQHCCPVKKLVERSRDGEISEIVYRGDHNHPKSQEMKQTSSSSRLKEQESVLDVNLRNFIDGLLADDDFFENKTECCDVEGLLDATSTMKALNSDDSIIVNHAEGGKDYAFDTMDSCEKRSQSRQYGDNTKGSSMVSQKTSIPKVVASIDYNYKIDDGYHWRKYGQKIVKGNSFPRNYYRCTNQNCSARKYVERATDDPGSFVTTYAGHHKH